MLVGACPLKKGTTAYTNEVVGLQNANMPM